MSLLRVSNSDAYSKHPAEMTYFGIYLFDVTSRLASHWVREFSWHRSRCRLFHTKRASISPFAYVTRQPRLIESSKSLSMTTPLAILSSYNSALALSRRWTTSPNLHTDKRLTDPLKLDQNSADSKEVTASWCHLVAVTKYEPRTVGRLTRSLLWTKQGP